MDTKRLAKFLIITFVITEMAWCGLAVLTRFNIISFSHPLGTILHIIGGFGPTIAACFVLEEKITVESILKFVFGYKKKSLIYFFLFAVFELLIIGLSSREYNSALSWYLIPFIFLQAIFIYGGEEELGWRGIMQPLLEKKLNFPVAAIITGIVWGIWHIPLWFVNGSSQQNMSFIFFLILAVILSFWLAAIYKKTECVKVNVLLVIGLLALLVYSIYLWYRGEATQ